MNINLARAATPSFATLANFAAVSLSAVSLSFASQDLLAQVVKPDGQWHGSAAAGISATTGNSKTNAININVDTAKETTEDKIALYGLALRASSKTRAGVSTTSADRLRLGGRYERNITDRIYGFGLGELERDGVANLDLRKTVAAGVGYKVIRNPNTTFDVFGGVAWTGNDYKAPLKDSSGAGLYLGEESTHKLSATSSFKQRLVVTPAGGDLGTRATWDVGLASSISGNLTMNAGLSFRHATKVPTGISKTDTLFIVGVGYKF